MAKSCGGARLAAVACWLGVTVLLLFATTAQGDVYTRMMEGRQRCFLEEVAKDTLIVATFSAVMDDVPVEEQATITGMVVQVIDPFDQLFLSRSTELTSRFAFTSPVDGEYKVCFATNTSHWFGHGTEFKFYLDINTGAQAIDYERVAKVEHLTRLDADIRQLNDVVRGLRAGQYMSRLRESIHRSNTDTMYSRIMWWSIAQILVLIASAALQIRALKNYFRQKKVL